MSDEDDDSVFSSIVSANIKFQLHLIKRKMASKKMTLTTKSPSSTTKNERYKDKKCDQLATNHLKKELFCEIKQFISSLQQDNKIGYMDEFIKATQSQIV